MWYNKVYQMKGDKHMNIEGLERKTNKRWKTSTYWKGDVLIAKECPNCKKIKEIEMFGVNKSTQNGINSICKECACERSKERHKANPEYAKQWRENNKEHIKERNAKYLEKNKEIIKEKRKRYVALHKKEISEYNKEYREKNKEYIKERNKKYRKENAEYIKEINRQYREKNKEIIKEKIKKHEEENKVKVKERQRRWYEENKEKQKQYREKNKEHRKEVMKQWYENNKRKRIEKQKQKYENSKNQNIAALTEKLNQIDFVLKNFKAYGSIYKFENTKTGKCYIGQTIRNLESRYNNSNIIKGWIKDREKRQNQKFLDELIEEDFIVTEVLDIGICKWHLDKLEAYYIDKYDSCNNGYNNNYGNYNTDDGIEEFNQILSEHNLEFKDGKLIQIKAPTDR